MIRICPENRRTNNTHSTGDIAHSEATAAAFTFYGGLLLLADWSAAPSCAEAEELVHSSFLTDIM